MTDTDGLEGARDWKAAVFQSVYGALFILAIPAALFGEAGGASAFDFFGLFGNDPPPAPSPNTLPYTIEFAISGDHSVHSALEQSSNFYKLRQNAPDGGFALVQRLKADFGPLVDALWGAGYYNADVSAVVGGVRFELDQTHEADVLRVVNAYQNRAPVPVTIVVETGPLFTLRNISVVDATSRLPFPSGLAA